MAVILISDSVDSATNQVMVWIHYYGRLPIRLSMSSYVENTAFSLFLNEKVDEVKLLVKGKPIDIEAVWYRLDSSQSNLDVNRNIHFSKELNRHLVFEQQALKRALFVKTKNCKWLSNYESTQLNKVAVLREAKSLGMCIPESLITSSREVLKTFIKIHGSVICKAAFENLFYVHTDTDSLMQYVEVLDSYDIVNLPISFFPSFFQRKIPKEYDVRVFYLDGKCYSMAIFSQSVDYRADYENHQNMPFKLPLELEQKIKELMTLLELNTGSLDFVKSSEDGFFYFLEVNPNGQFERLSSQCNYYIEREIAKYLCHGE